MIHQKRNESDLEYADRKKSFLIRRKKNKILKNYLKTGANIWDSTKRGTYIRKQHGQIGTKHK